MSPLRCLLAATLVLTFPTLRAQQERITDFDSTIAVQKNGDLIVTELISAIAAGDAIKRGIYRDFPTLYRGTFGLKRSVAFEVLEVLRAGEPEPWHSERRENGLRIYIGDSDRLVPHGPHRYTIRYRTNRQLVLGEDFDELYWNVTGNGWAFPIDHAVARVELPPGASVRSEEAYTGITGETGGHWRVVTSAGADSVIETTRPLEPGEGFTISVSWQKGIVDATANPTGPLEIARDNPWLILGLLGVAAVFVYYASMWFQIGRDPAKGTIIPLYGPPEGFTPAAVRYLAGLGRFDDRSFAAAVLALAVARVLKIKRASSGEYAVERTDGSDDALTPTQRAFFEKLLGSRKKLAFKNTNHSVFKEARGALKSGLKNEIETRYFVRNSNYWVGGLLLSLVPAGIAIIDARDVGGAFFMTLWLSFWSFGVAMLLTAVVNGWKSGKFFSAIPTTLFAIPFLLGWIFGAAMLIHATSVWVAVVFFTAFLLNLVFYHLLKAPTIEGRRIMDRIEGFKMYLSVAEKDRLDLENPPERTPEEFERFLPYALALDVEQRWAEQFSDVLEQAHYDPDWYHGSGSGRFNPSALAGAVGGAMASAISSSSSAPGSSSGSGGGGSSGGGGGGGGGGGW